MMWTSGSSLGSGKHRPVQLLRELLAAQHQAAARPAQSLVGGGGHEIHVRDGAWVQPRGDQARDVRHVGHRQCAHGAGDLADPLKSIMRG